MLDYETIDIYLGFIFLSGAAGLCFSSFKSLCLYYHVPYWVVIFLLQCEPVWNILISVLNAVIVWTCAPCTVVYGRVHCNLGYRQCGSDSTHISNLHDRYQAAFLLSLDFTMLSIIFIFYSKPCRYSCSILCLFKAIGSNHHEIMSLFRSQSGWV